MRVALLVAALVLGARSEGRADRATETPEVRAIAYLAREVPRWRRENGCASCHHNGDGARALFRARRLGFEVAEEATADSARWLLHPESWDDNRGEGAFSDKWLARIEFAHALVEAVEAGAIADRPALARAADRLAEDQQPDGSWRLDGPDTIGSPASYGRPLATLVARDVLQAADPDRHRDRIAAAEAWLRGRPIRTVMDASIELLLGGRRPTTATTSRRTLARSLLGESQSPEGGWGPYAASPPEVFDTALALLALADEGSDRMAATILRGRSYLISTQLPSGGWIETTRPSGGESYAQQVATTAWAALALLATRPLAEAPASDGSSIDPERDGNGAGLGPPLDPIEDVDLEGTADAVTCRIFEVGVDDEAIRARGPGRIRFEAPGGFLMADLDAAPDIPALGIDDAREADEQGMIERLGGRDDQGASPAR